MPRLDALEGTNVNILSSLPTVPLPPSGQPSKSATCPAWPQLLADPANALSPADSVLNATVKPILLLLDKSQVISRSGCLFENHATCSPESAWWTPGPVMLDQLRSEVNLVGVLHRSVPSKLI